MYPAGAAIRGNDCRVMEALVERGPPLTRLKYRRLNFKDAQSDDPVTILWQYEIPPAVIRTIHVDAVMLSRGNLFCGVFPLNRYSASTEPLRLKRRTETGLPETGIPATESTLPETVIRTGVPAECLPYLPTAVAPDEMRTSPLSGTALNITYCCPLTVTMESSTGSPFWVTSALVQLSGSGRRNESG